jgi:hypothetical protein
MTHAAAVNQAGTTRLDITWPSEWEPFAEESRGTRPASYHGDLVGQDLDPAK